MVGPAQPRRAAPEEELAWLGGREGCCCKELVATGTWVGHLMLPSTLDSKAL